MAILTPIPRVGTSYSKVLYSGTNITGVTLASGSLPTGLATSFTSTTVTLSGTPTTTGNYSFGLTITRSIIGGNVSLSYVSVVVLPALPASGAIKYSDIRARIGVSGSLSASNTRFKYLANGSTANNPVAVSSTRLKPVAGNQNVVASSNSWTVPAYQAMIFRVSGAGGGGGKGQAGLWNGQFCYYSNSGAYNGGAGGPSTLFSFVSNGGEGGLLNGFSGADGGNNQNANLGGGSNGGASILGNNDGSGCSGTFGGPGGDGGLIESTVRIAASGPEYASSTTITGGTLTAPSNATVGYVYVEWA